MEDINIEEVSDLLVRKMPKASLEMLSQKANAVNQDRQEFVRELLVKASVIPERYAYRVIGQVGKGGIRRYSDHVNGTTSTFGSFNQDEADAMHRAENFIRRNQPGDREKAVNLLVAQFGEDNVFEVPL